MFDKPKYHISIYTPTVAIIVLAVTLVVLFCLRGQQMNHSSDEILSLEKTRQSCLESIYKFINASDFLTTQMWQYVSTQDRMHMDAYWKEVNVLRNRDNALRELLDSEITSEERASAIGAKVESDRLINGERWAMRMTAEGMGMPREEMPVEVASVELMPSDKALSPEEKKRKAIDYAFGPDYSKQKQLIVAQVDDFNYEVNKHYTDLSMVKMHEFQKTIRYMSVLQVTLLSLLLLCFMIFLFLVLIPIIRYLRIISKLDGTTDTLLKPSGSREMYHFARIFNKMYRQLLHRNRELDMLSKIDYLTRIPNRATITEYLEKELKKSTPAIGILIIDIDSFKSFNDTYGHMIGDRVLIILAEYLVSVVPAKDGIAGRLCGEEFVIILPGTTQEKVEALATKILTEVPVMNINSKIVGRVQDNITVSIGSTVIDGRQNQTFIKSIHQADMALYHSKRSGKNSYTAYHTLNNLI